jgi:hypothetical protein
MEDNMIWVIRWLAASASLVAILTTACSSSPAIQQPSQPKTAPAGQSQPASAPAQPAAATKAAPAQFVIGSLEEPGNLNALAALPHHFPEHAPQTFMFIA